MILKHWSKIRWVGDGSQDTKLNVKALRAHHAFEFQAMCTGEANDLFMPVYYGTCRKTPRKLYEGLDPNCCKRHQMHSRIYGLTSPSLRSIMSQEEREIHLCR